MSTISLTVSSAIASGQYLSVSVTYNITSTDTQTIFTATAFSWTKPANVALRFMLSASGYAPLTNTQAESAGTSGSSALVFPYTVSTDKTKTSQSKTITLEILEGTTRYNPSTGRLDFTGTSRGTETQTFTVPALASYTISYNANNHGTAPSSQTKYYGIALTLQPAISASGFTFVRWNTNANNTGTGYNAGANYTANSATTLYAIWNHTVTYSANGGAGVPNEQTALATSAITIPSIIPVRPGYRFKYWYTTSTGTGGTAYNPGNTYAAQLPNITLYAIWEKAISAVSIGTITAIRVSDASSTEEADEGEYAYLQIPYTISGEASAHAVIEVEVDSEDPSITVSPTTVDKPETSTPVGGICTVRASDCAIDSKYVFTVTITASNTTAGSTQSNVISSKSVMLASAYFVLDVKAGGKGIHFGGSAVNDGFWVSMPSYFVGNSPRILSTLDSSSTPSETVFWKAIGIDYTDGTEIAALYAIKQSDDTIGGQFEVARTIGNTRYINNVRLFIGPTGTNTVTVTSPAAWRSAIGALNKAGDSMTGDLKFTNGNAVYLNTNSVDYTLGVTRSSPAYTGGIYSYDRNENRTYYSEMAASADGSIYRSYVLIGKLNGSNYTSGFYTGLHADGSAYFSITGTGMAASMRSAIGAVSKAGDSLTGNLSVTKSSGDTGMFFERTDIVNGRLLFGYGASNNGGIYSYRANKWIFNLDSNNNIYVAGLNFTNAIQARNSIGAVNRAGDTLTANFTLSATDTTGRWYKVKNSLHEGSLYVDGSGNLGLWSDSKSKWIIRCTTAGKVYVNGGWTQIAQVQGNTSATYTLGAYTECLLMIWHSTDFLGTVTFPVDAVGTGQHEMYVGGWGNNASNSNRAGCARVSNTTLTGFMVRVNNSEVTSASYFRLYAR